MYRSSIRPSHSRRCFAAVAVAAVIAGGGAAAASTSTAATAPVAPLKPHVIGIGDSEHIVGHDRLGWQLHCPANRR